MNIDAEVHGADEFIELRVRANTEMRREIESILDEASKVALRYMQRHIPKGRQIFHRRHGVAHRSLLSSLGRGPIVYRPGAAFGGGFYEMQVGAINNPPEHLDLVFHGTTGVPKSRPARFDKRLRPSEIGGSAAQRRAGFTLGQFVSAPGHRTRFGQRGNVGKLMTIQKLGEPVKFRMTRAGQKPQQGWYHGAIREANAFLRARLQKLNI